MNVLKATSALNKLEAKCSIRGADEDHRCAFCGYRNRPKGRLMHGADCPINTLRDVVTIWRAQSALLARQRRDRRKKPSEPQVIPADPTGDFTLSPFDPRHWKQIPIGGS